MEQHRPWAHLGTAVVAGAMGWGLIVQPSSGPALQPFPSSPFHGCVSHWDFPRHWLSWVSRVCVSAVCCCACTLMSLWLCLAALRMQAQRHPCHRPGPCSPRHPALCPPPPRPATHPPSGLCHNSLGFSLLLLFLLNFPDFPTSPPCPWRPALPAQHSAGRELSEPSGHCWPAQLLGWLALLSAGKKCAVRSLESSASPAFLPTGCLGCQEGDGHGWHRLSWVQPWGAWHQSLVCHALSPAMP